MNIITRTLFSSLLILLTFTACDQPQTDEDLRAKAMDIHDRVITLDTHVDINTANFTAEQNYTEDLNTQVTLPKMEEGMLDVAWFIVYTGQDTLSQEGYAAAYENAIDKFEAIHRLVDDYAPDQIELATTSEEVRDIVSKGKKVAMIGVENAYPVGTDLSRIKEFYDLGARYMSLSHNGHNQFSDSNTGERDSVWMYNGLSELGREAVAEINKWGIMIDISHPSREANLETMELSKAPVIASHSSARALSDVSRNLSDEELMALKENGGVVQTVAFRSYVDAEKHRMYNEEARKIRDRVAEEMEFEQISWSEYRELTDAEQDEYMAKRDEMMRRAEPIIQQEVHDIAPPVDVADFVDHIDYMVELIGIEHVGISSDFDGGGGVEGWMDASETFNVTLELVKRGYTEQEISMLWSENLLRVLDEVEAVAQQIQSEDN